ncbi:MAG: NAD(P)H-dependent oxidoreductase subunit E [Treponema sp.]|jgi:NADH-quinone oxidoreductase subunit E|nr:NAD(P)H-dependent oxidoreductase subunit E [Treponema sp.]
MAGDFGKKFELVCDILDRYERDSGNLIAILQEIQEAYSYLPEDIMTYVATALEISPGAVFGVATFYSHFTLEPKGKYIIKVCDGTACHVKKSTDIIKMLEGELGLNQSKKTTDDLMFTLETVACLGACGLAPAVVVNEEVHGAMNVEKTKVIIEKIKKEEAANV